MESQRALEGQRLAFLKGTHYQAVNVPRHLTDSNRRVEVCSLPLSLSAKVSWARWGSNPLLPAYKTGPVTERVLASATPWDRTRSLQGFNLALFRLS